MEMDSDSEGEEEEEGEGQQVSHDTPCINTLSPIALMDRYFGHQLRRSPIMHRSIDHVCFFAVDLLGPYKPQLGYERPYIGHVGP
jgi:hypothetical protein